ncbi:terminase small subunit [Veillonella rodentium]|jgi:phage terminase, small subunit|uniref:Terminase small subunit n=1 Tax=Veillonella rodentium TaxID=248315 RepID=A0A239Z9J1_9FIRM|nr:terminase small subunit [Veillonella rodentium]DAF71661.1 MAG TPA: Terminase small subunit [Caudoviricetes sp.]SNV67587.1 Terminase small subunit [Veillonella rodentium]DAF78120.1 MAG TPA: Terminase small subunit [Caudoviricetes sp.]DAH51262.1 MAG TPA: Terminase small subunit [Caudoviricetes sp.]DAN15450.1 MAG TPA: Terminase small subunit [Caudoviricetes sp.]
MADANTLTEKERIFADEYIKTTNATQSAIKAGYSEKTASSKGSQLLRKVKVRQYIDEVMDKRSKNTIATADEVLQYLSRVMNGEEKDAFGLDVSVADRTKAAELLGKRHMLFTDKVKLDAEIEIDISDRMKQARVKSDEVQQGTTD